MKSGWIKEPLGSCAQFVDYRGKTPPKTERGVRLITAKNVKMGFIQTEPKEYIDPYAYEGWMTRGFPEVGDVLFTTEAPLGNVAQLDSSEKVVIGQRLITFKTDPKKTDPTYLKYALLSPVVQEEIHSRATGATVQGIKASLLKHVPIPLPPLEEQWRIVAVLDEAFEGLARARVHTEANLQNARELFELRRAGIFSAHSEGEAAYLEDVCLGFEYGTAAKSLSKGRVPVLRMGNLQDGEIDWTDLVYSNDAGDCTRYLLKPGDVLFNRTNSVAHVGKTSIFDGKMPAIFAGYLIRVTPDPARLIPRFLNHFLNSDVARQYGRSVMGTSVNQANISGGRLKRYSIRLPSLSRQEELADELDTLKEAVKPLQSNYRAKLQDLDDLRKSLLQKAFAGELT